MEYIDGEDLSTVLRSRGRFTANDAVEVSAALADVLDRAHQFVAVVDGETYHGIVHGNLKPRNIRICVASDACEHDAPSLAARVRVLDFGVAKGIRGAAGETRNVFGSAPYMSPERLIDGHVSTMSDCWSLGVVLCELLAGAPPFQGSERDVLRQIDSGPPALPARLPGRSRRARPSAAGARSGGAAHVRRRGARRAAAVARDDPPHLAGRRRRRGRAAARREPDAAHRGRHRPRADQPDLRRPSAAADPRCAAAGAWARLRLHAGREQRQPHRR